MSKKIVSFSLIGLSMFILSGCSSKEVTIENKQPEKYFIQLGGLKALPFSLLKLYYSTFAHKT